MKQVLIILFTFFAVAAFGQVRPDDFPVDTTPSDTDAFYTQEAVGGIPTARKIWLSDLKDYYDRGDSTRLVQDSILVYYKDGGETGRDTIRVDGGGGGGGVYVATSSTALTDSILGFVRNVTVSDSTISYYDARVKKFVQLRLDIYVNDFGLSESETALNNGAAFRAAIDYAAANGVTKLLIKDGTYNIGYTGGVDGEIVNIDGVDGLEIKGSGKHSTVFIGNKNNGLITSYIFIRLRNSKRVTISDFTFKSEFERAYTMTQADPENSIDSSYHTAISVIESSTELLNADGLTISNVNNENLYGIAININDNIKNFRIRNCDFKKLMREVVTTVQPTGILINKATSGVIDKCNFEDIIDFGTSGLSHGIYIGGGASNINITNCHLELTPASGKDWTSGNGGIQFLGTAVDNVNVSDCFLKNVKCDFNNINRSKVSNSTFENTQIGMDNTSNFELSNNYFEITKDIQSFNGLIISKDDDVTDIKISGNTFVAPIDSLSAPQYGLGIQALNGGLRWEISNNSFFNTPRPINIGRVGQTEYLDSSFIVNNLFFPQKQGEAFITLERGRYNSITGNKVYLSPNSTASAATIVRDSDATANDVIGNHIDKNESFFTDTEPYSQVTNNKVSFNNNYRYNLKYGTSAPKRIEFFTNNTERMVIDSITGSIGIGGATDPTYMLDVGTPSNTAELRLNVANSSNRFIYFGDGTAPITANQALNIYTNAGGTESKFQNYGKTGQIVLSIGNLDNTAFRMYGPTHSTNPCRVSFSSDAPTSDAIPGDISFTAASARTVAVTNRDGASLVFTGGNSATAGGMGGGVTLQGGSGQGAEQGGNISINGGNSATGEDGNVSIATLQGNLIVGGDSTVFAGYNSSYTNDDVTITNVTWFNETTGKLQKSDPEKIAMAITSMGVYTVAGAIGTADTKARITTAGTYTLPSVTVWTADRNLYPITIKNASGGSVTLNRAGSDTIYNTTGPSETSITLLDGESVTLSYGGANKWDVE